MSPGALVLGAGVAAGLIALHLGLAAAQRRNMLHMLRRRRQALAIGVACLCAAVFTCLALSVVHGETPSAFDLRINEAVAPLRHPGLVLAFAWITGLASIPTLSAVAIAASALLAVAGPRRDLIPVWVAIIGNEATTWSAKHLIDRPRPGFTLDVIAQSPSFPSGHASGALAVYGVLAYVLSRRMASPQARLAFVYWTTVLIGSIAISRVFLDVHHATDVVAGLAVGGFWLIAAAILEPGIRDGIDGRDRW